MNTLPPQERFAPNRLLRRLLGPIFGSGVPGGDLHGRGRAGVATGLDRCGGA